MNSTPTQGSLRNNIVSELVMNGKMLESLIQDGSKEEKYIYVIKGGSPEGRE
jgi:hypothetical protein